MRRLIALSLIPVLVAACSREDAQPPQPVEASPSRSAPATPAVGYACESGQTVSVAYGADETARLTYQGRAYDLRLAPSASGARYTGSGLEWWSASRDGQESATLSRLGPNEQVGSAVLERCGRPTSGGGDGSGEPTGMVAVTSVCRTEDLSARIVGGDAGAGNRGAVIELTNTGDGPCSLSGYPAVQAQDAQGRALTALRVEERTGGYFRPGETPGPVSLTPEGKAFFDVTWNVVEGQGPCARVARLAITIGEDRTPLLLSTEFQPCGGRIGVTPFRAEGGAAVGNPTTTAAAKL